MRIFWALLVSCLPALAVRSDEAKPTDTIRWGEAFSAISAATSSEKTVLMVITNDDPAIATRPSTDQDDNQPLWCLPVLTRSLMKAWQARPELRDKIILQQLPVGMPAKLTGGQLRNQPARAIIAICDGNYRLLSLTVGVPGVDELLTMIEDAEDARTLCQMHQEGSRQKLIASIGQRSAGRLGRMWRGALEEMMVAMGDGDFDEDADVPEATRQKQAGRLVVLHDNYQPTYLADVKLRFGLTEAADRTRLVILEQHSETRRPWAEAAIPFLVDEDFVTLWQPLCETLWGNAPIQLGQSDEALLQWWDSLGDTDSVVLSLQPPLLTQRLPWPPITDKRGLSWSDVQELAVALPYRSVNAQQLSTLLHTRDLKPVDIEMPSRARYLYFESKKKAGSVFREGEAPGRFVGILKRAK